MSDGELAELAKFMGADHCDINEDGLFEFCSDDSVITYTHDAGELLGYITAHVGALMKLCYELSRMPDAWKPDGG